MKLLGNKSSGRHLLKNAGKKEKSKDVKINKTAKTANKTGDTGSNDVSKGKKG